MRTHISVAVALVTVCTSAFALADRPPPPAGAEPPESAARAPRSVPPNDGVAFGFALHRFQDDFGLGGLIASPSFAGDSIRVVGGGGVAWYPHARDADGNETWKSYGHGRLVLEGGAKLRGAPMRLYGFGGGALVLPPASFTDKKAFFGGVGGFGFEFLFRQPEGDGPVRYFLELGATGIGAKADKVPGHPIFANGFLASVGLRVYAFNLPAARHTSTQRAIALSANAAR